MGCGAGAQRYSAEPSQGQSVARVEVKPTSHPSGAAGATAGDAGEGFEAKPLAIHVGSAVKLRDLKAQPELNGCVGTAMSYDPASDRWTVRLSSGVEKAIRADNLLVAPLKAGTYVRIEGLKADTALNNMVGIIEGYDAATDRWTVKLSGGVRKALKKSNLVTLQKETRADPEELRLQQQMAADEGPTLAKGRWIRPSAFEVLLDGQLHKALHEGHARLVRGAYFERRASEEQPWQRRQDISEDDLWPPDEAAHLWTKFGSAFLLAVSYTWISREHPDPEMYHLQRLARVIEEWRGSSTSQLFQTRLWPKPAGKASTSAAAPGAVEGPPDVGIFVDFCCLPQKPGGGPAREDTMYHPCMEVMALLYGHMHTSVLRFTSVPMRLEKKYFHRGWTAFESCIAGNKPYGDDKVYEFGDAFKHDSELARKEKFFRKYKQPLQPPVSYERFSDLLWRVEEQVKMLRYPYDKLFTQAEDKAWALNKFREAWEEQRKVRELDFKYMGWGDAEALQLAAALPSFPNLGTLHLNGNKIGDAGAEAILGALVNSELHSLDLSDNGIGREGAAKLAASLSGAPDLAFLFLFANPLCSEDDARWQVVNAWKAAGKTKENLVLDHFAVKARPQK